jgi:hypothetical protein
MRRLSPAAAHMAATDADTFIVDTRPGWQRRRAGEIPGAIVVERNHLEWRLDPDSASPRGRLAAPDRPTA